MQMQLIRTRQITYTTPPTPEEAAALSQIERIDSKKKPTDADRVNRDALAATVTPATQYRFTISTCRALDHARFMAARRQWPRWLEEQTGAKFDDAIATEEGLQKAILCDRWARMMGALIAIEERQIDRVASQDDGAGWQPAEMPAAWKTDPGAYMDEAPAELIDAIDEAANALNPGLFMPEMSIDAKKNGGISAK